MRKIILKTAFITFSVTLILAVSVFGIMSLSAPAVMMRLAASVGMQGVSGDYAYQQYELSRGADIDCLARSFLIAADQKNDHTALSRFEVLFAHERFEEYCAEQEPEVPEGVGGYTYRNYIVGQAARVKYRLALTEEEKNAAADFAVSETDSSFPAGNPVVALAVEAAGNRDGAFCTLLLARVRAAGFEKNTDYDNITKILEECE